MPTGQPGTKGKVRIVRAPESVRAQVAGHGGGRFTWTDLVDWTVRLIPAVALFSLFFAFEGNMRWLGVLGLLPFFMAFHRDCPSCDPRARARGGASGFRTFAGH
ncbi:MAG: hypothetical protein H6907_02790 [Hyphomicrobiales bacterium]|nr:hypothetical protein [Hyphomicrobiales bacterium]